jgi:hypothetical protein
LDGLYRPVVVSGRAAHPDRPDEMVVSTATARRYPVGSTIQWRRYTGDQLSLLDGQPNLLPVGSHQGLRVVGVVRDPADADLSGIEVVYGTLAMAGLVDADSSGFAAGISLRRGERDQVEFAKIVRRELAKERIPPGSGEVVTTAPGRVEFEDTLRPLVVGLIVIAVAVVVFGLAALGLVAARMLATNQGDQLVLRSLGLTPRDRALVGRAGSL